MYVSAQTARLTLWQRREDVQLQRRLRDDLGPLPDFLRAGPRAVLARQLATPNFEFHIFAARARSVGLKIVCPDYAADKFCSGNPDKLALARQTFFLGEGESGGYRTRSHWLIDVERFDGKPLRMIETLWGEGLVSFHHRLLQQHFPGVEVMDNSCWLARMGGQPARFWPRLLSLFICDGILFENFHTQGHESEFTRRIIRPAFAEVTAHYGLQPLIVPLLPIARERDPYWSWYPSLLEQEVLRGLQSPILVAEDPAFVPLPLAAWGERHG